MNALRVAADRPGFDAIVLASLLATPRHPPDVEGDKSVKRKFKTYPIDYCHTDIAEVRTELATLHMFVAIDRTSEFAFVELHEKAASAV